MFYKWSFLYTEKIFEAEINPKKCNVWVQKDPHFCEAFSKPYNLIKNYQILTFDNFIALKIKNAVRWFKCVKRNFVCSLLQPKGERRGEEDTSQHPTPRIWAHIRGRYWSAKKDDISLWPPAASGHTWSHLRQYRGLNSLWLVLWTGGIPYGCEKLCLTSYSVFVYL